MVHCPCESTKSLTECCGPLLDGTRGAETAEELMRSRYSAYARGQVDYILATIVPEQREHHEEATIRQWSTESEWLGLEIVEHAPDPGDEAATVEFVARYKNAEGELIAHHERSRFVKIEGDWFFQDGQPVEAGTIVRDSPKVGRNDPCPCGSGRKSKKCCAAAG